MTNIHPDDLTAPALPGSYDQIAAAWRQLGAWATHIPFQPLLPAEQRRLGGLLLPCAAHLVDRLAHGLIAEPERLRDIIQATGESGHELRAAQDLVGAWNALAARLQLLAEQARHTAMRLQAGLVLRALLVLKYVRHSETQPGRGRMPTAQAVMRRVLLVGAFKTISDYYDSLRERRKKRPAETAAPASPRSAKARTRARQQDKDLVWARVEQIFRAHLAARRPATPPPATPPPASPPPATPPPASPPPASSPPSTPPSSPPPSPLAASPPSPLAASLPSPPATPPSSPNICARHCAKVPRARTSRKGPAPHFAAVCRFRREPRRSSLSRPAPPATRSCAPGARPVPRGGPAQRTAAPPPPPSPPAWGPPDLKENDP